MHVLSSILLLLGLAFSSVDPRIVTTSLGKLEGVELGEFHIFKKVPFSKPPLGKLRFQKPVPPARWHDVLNAKEYGPACMSNYSRSRTIQKVLDEDCLHLNIFTSEKCLKSKECAVVDYIHGGALHYDSAVMFNDAVILNNFVSKDIVFVIPAFRLGIFSHFVVEDQSIAPNNVGLFDILLAMEFVKSEINNFGGDSNRITLLGHSYGGTLAAMLTFSTEVNRDLSLFQQCISMSAPSNFETLELQMEKTVRFAEEANCIPKTSKNLKSSQKELYMRDCLQKIDAKELLRIQRKLEEEEFPTYGGSVLRGPIFQEVPETKFLDTPKNVSTLTGCTKYEILPFDSYDNIGLSLGFENWKEVNAKYQRDRENEELGFPSTIRDETQEMFVQTKARVDKLLKKGIPTFQYELSYPKHSGHSDDLFYVMGVHPYEMDENEEKIGETYRAMITNFIKTGKPGNGFEMTDLKTASYFDVCWNETSGERPMMKSNFEQKILKYWTKDMVRFDSNISKLKQKTVSRSIRSFNSPFGYSVFPFSYVILLLLPFLAGILIAKYCCSGDQRNLYIQIDGSDYPIKS